MNLNWSISEFVGQTFKMKLEIDISQRNPDWCISKGDGVMLQGLNRSLAKWDYQLPLLIAMKTQAD